MDLGVDRTPDEEGANASFVVGTKAAERAMDDAMASSAAAGNLILEREEKILQISERWADLWNVRAGVREDELLMTKKKHPQVSSFGGWLFFFVALTAPPD